MRLLTRPLHALKHRNQQFLQVRTHHVRQERALKLIMVWVHLALESALVEGIGCHRVGDLGRPQLLQLVDPEIKLAREAPIIKAAAADEAEFRIVASIGFEGLVLLDQEVSDSRKTAVVEPLGIGREGLLGGRAVLTKPLPKITETVHQGLLTLHKLEALLHSHRVVRDVRKHFKTKEVRVSIVVDAGHILEVGLRPVDGERGAEQAIDVEDEGVFEEEFEVVG